MTRHWKFTMSFPPYCLGWEGFPAMPTLEQTMKRYSNSKEINAEVQKLTKVGWIYYPGKKHGSIKSPTGLKVIIPGSPSDYRAHFNFKRDIKHVLQKGTNHGY